MTSPRDWIVSGDWPRGSLDAAAPRHIRKVANAAARVTRYLDASGGSRSNLARQSGCDEDELARFLDGHEVPSIEVLACLERSLNIEMWK